MPDGDGSVLDHILIYKGSNMGNSHRHAHVKVPVILVGGIDGTFKGNRHIVFPDDTTQKTSNMLLSILHLYGIEQGQHRPKLRTSSRSGLDGFEMKKNRSSVARLSPSLWLAAPASPAREEQRGRVFKCRRGPCEKSFARTARPVTASMNTRTSAFDAAGWQNLIQTKHKSGDLKISDEDLSVARGLDGQQVRPDNESFSSNLRRPGNHDVLLGS